MPDHMLEDMGRQQEDFPTGSTWRRQFSGRAVNVVITRMQLDRNQILGQHQCAVRGHLGRREERPRAQQLPFRKEDIDVADLAGRRVRIILRRFAPFLDDGMQSGVSQLLQQLRLHVRIARIRPGERLLHGPQDWLELLWRPLLGREMCNPFQEQAHHGLFTAQGQQLLPPGRIRLGR